MVLKLIFWSSFPVQRVCVHSTEWRNTSHKTIPGSSKVNNSKQLMQLLFDIGRDWGR